jgi:uncharacterized RDD family membrane protein YckC
MSLGTPTALVFADDYSRLSGYVPAGFWHRFFAFVIDVIVVSILCFAMAEFFRDFFAHAPAWAAFLGFVVITSYFAIFGSKVVDGQTLGMMATSVKVAASDGSTISLQRSSLRYAILFAPFLLSSAVLPRWTSPMIAYAYDMAMAFAGSAVVYLAIFNRRTGQSLHDLATQTFVVDCSGDGPVHAAEFWKPHWAILLGLLILGLIVPHMSSTFGELTSVENAVARIPGAAEVNVKLTFSGNGSRIIVKTGCDQISEDHNKAAARIAAAVLNGDANATEHDYIEIDCVTTLQVGFFKSTTNNYFTHTPQQWMALIQD